MRLFPLLAAVLLAAAPAALSPAADLPKAAAPAEEEEGKIDGRTLARPDGRFLGVETEGVTLKITFYDKKKKKGPADAIRIAVRWSDTQLRRTVLLPAAPETLVSPPVLRRPFGYIVHLALVGADEKVSETYSLNLSGS